MKRRIEVTEYINELAEDGISVEKMFRRFDELKDRIMAVPVDLADVKVEDIGYDNTTLVIKYDREETDHEYKSRLDYEEKAKAKAAADFAYKEKREYETYLRLKQKYEGSSQ